MIHSVEVGETGREKLRGPHLLAGNKDGTQDPSQGVRDTPRLYFHFLHSLQRARDAEGQGCQTKKQTKIPTKISWLFYEA